MFKTVALLVLLTGILLAVGWWFAGIFGMTIALIFAILINFASYWYSDKIVLKIYSAQPNKNKELENIVDKIAIEAKIPKPKLYTIPTEIPNAFATGRNPEHAAIAVTHGLLSLDKEELAGVLAHEIAHIRNRDILISTIAATIAGAIAYLAQIGYWSLFFGGRRGGENIFGLILIIIFAPLAALLVRMAISRSREYKADFTGAILTKKPLALASALKKISAIAKERPLNGPTATSHLWIVNPFHTDWFTGLFSTHPPLPERIKRLEDMRAKEKKTEGEE